MNDNAQVAAAPSPPKLGTLPIAVATLVFWIATAALVFVQWTQRQMDDTLFTCTVVALVASAITSLWLLIKVVQRLLAGASWKACSLAILPATLPPFAVLSMYYFFDFRRAQLNPILLLASYATLALPLFFPLCAWHLQRRAPQEPKQLISLVARIGIVQILGAVVLLPIPLYMTACVARADAMYVGEDPAWAANCVRATPGFVKSLCFSVCTNRGWQEQAYSILAKGNLPLATLKEYFINSSNATLQMLAVEAMYEDHREAVVQLTLDAVTDATSPARSKADDLIRYVGNLGSDADVDRLLALDLSIAQLNTLLDGSMPHRQKYIFDKVKSDSRYQKLVPPPAVYLD